MASADAWKLQLHLPVEQLTSSLSTAMHQHRSHETTFMHNNKN